LQLIKNKTDIMIEFNVPGHGDIQIEHLVLDYNGTLATDGHLLPDVSSFLLKISKLLSIHIITADTHGSVKEQLGKFPFEINILGTENQEVQKQAYIESLGTSTVIAIGNGLNDRLMLRDAEIGISVVNHEGAAMKTAMEADIICFSIIDALELVIFPKRMVATLRN